MNRQAVGTRIGHWGSGFTVSVLMTASFILDTTRIDFHI